jgi:hypothetical protein
VVIISDDRGGPWGLSHLIMIRLAKCAHFLVPRGSSFCANFRSLCEYQRGDFIFLEASDMKLLSIRALKLSQRSIQRLQWNYIKLYCSVRRALVALYDWLITDRITGSFLPESDSEWIESCLSRTIFLASRKNTIAQLIAYFLYLLSFEAKRTPQNNAVNNALLWYKFVKIN